METIGSGLMTTARWDDAVAQFEDWIERYASTGPPTFLYNSLGFLGYTLQLRGDVDAARKRFLEAADVAVPPGTYAATRPAEVEALFQRGDHDRARTLLLEHVDDVLAMGTVDVARLVAVAFVNLMAGLDRLEDAAPGPGLPRHARRVRTSWHERASSPRPQGASATSSRSTGTPSRRCATCDGACCRDPLHDRVVVVGSRRATSRSCQTEQVPHGSHA